MTFVIINKYASLEDKRIYQLFWLNNNFNTFIKSVLLIVGFYLLADLLMYENSDRST